MNYSSFPYNSQDQHGYMAALDMEGPGEWPLEWQLCKAHLESLAANALLYGGMVGQHQQALLEWTVPFSIEQVLHLAARLNLVAEHNRPCAVLKTHIHSHSVLLVFPLSELMLNYSGVPELMHTDMQAMLCVTEGIGSHLLL